MKDGKKITASREESTSYMNQTLPMRESFDLIQRDLMIGERMASFYFINGLNKDDDMLKLMDALLKIKKEEISTKIAQSISRQGFQPRAFREILLAALQILREYIRKLRIPSKPKLGIDMKEFYEMENLKSKLDQKQE